MKLNVPQTLNECLLEVANTRGRSKQLFKLDDYCKGLEDEMKKIEAFKRELPLCMLLLNDAIEKLKEELMQCTKRQELPKTKEFMPLKGKNSKEDGGDKRVNDDSSDKRNWMSSFQLWSFGIDDDHEKQYSVSEQNLEREEDDRSVCENSTKPYDNRNKGGTFVPFNGQSCFARIVVEQGKEVSKLGSCNTKISFSRKVKYQYTPEQLQHVYKKPRRSWSPELHRLFLVALVQLGGSQVATPKQIKQLMQVDGLTTGEVKSHLQKFRLHIRRLSNSAADARPTSRWASQDQYEDHSINKSDHSPQGPFLASGSAKDISSTSGGISFEAEQDDRSYWP